MEHHQFEQSTDERQQQVVPSISSNGQPPLPLAKTTHLCDHVVKCHRNGDDSTSRTEATPKRLFIVIGSLYLGTFLVALDTTIIGTAIPAITTDFHALDAIVWYGSGYLLTLTALQPTFGKLYKVINTKLLYLCCIAIFECL